MARLSPFSGKRPERYRETKTITSPATGQEDTLTLQYLDKPLQHLAVDIASKLVVQYVGFPEEGVWPKMDFNYLGGGKVEVSESLCRTVGNIYVMQCPREDGGAIFSVDELIALSVTDEEFWDELEKFAEEVNKKGRALKNGQRVSGGSGSTMPCDTNSSIPKSSLEPISCSAESMNDSEYSADILQATFPAGM